MTLAEYLTENLERPFKYGEWDCVIAITHWLWYATGRDDYLDDLPAWQTPLEAARLVKSLGGLETAMNDRFKRILPAAAHDGDIALYDGCLCLFSGQYVVGPGERGLTHVDRLLVEHAWTVRE